MNTEANEAQQLLDAAFAGTLNLDAVDSAPVVTAAEAATPTVTETTEAVTVAATDNAATNASSEEQEGAPIAAKSGGYTIPYEKLSEARTRAKTLEEENNLLKAQLADLSAKQQSNLSAAQAEAAARANAGEAPTSSDKQVSIAQAAIGQGVDPDIFGDFSEDAIAKGIQTLVNAQVSQVQDRVDARLNELLAPMQKQQQETAQSAHYRAIYEAHPDADSLLESREMAEWQAKQPAFVRDGIAAAIKSGSAQQVIEIFDTFKAATATPEATDQNKAKSKIAEAMKAAAEVVPASLSELAGGTVGVSDVERANALAGDPVKLMEFMSTLSADKANRLMNAIV